MKKRHLKTVALFAAITIFFACKQTSATDNQSEYNEIKKQLTSGWNTFNTWNSLSYVYMPEGFEIAFDLKYQGHNFSGYMQRANFIEGQDHETPKLRALAHAWDGSYTRIAVDWAYVNVIIETATDGDDFVALITSPDQLQYPSHVIVRAGIIFNRPGSIVKKDDTIIGGHFRNRNILVYPATPVTRDFAVATSTPYFSMNLKDDAQIPRRHTLLGVISFIEEGLIPAPEEPIL